MSKVITNGIQFGNVANTGANVLDWYEEGTWTPTFHGTGGSMGNTVVSGGWVRIGKTVSVNLYFTLGSTWVAGTGGITIPQTFAPTVDQTFSTIAMYDTSVNAYYWWNWRPSDGMIFKGVDGPVAAALVTDPFTFAVGDYVAIGGNFQVF